jgi:hypothetical protein
VPFPGAGGGRWQISTDSAEWLVGWKDDGTELYFLDREMAMSRVKVEAGEGFAGGAPERLFPVTSELTWSNFGDGKSFVTARGPEQSGTEPITLVVDWLPERRQGE